MQNSKIMFYPNSKQYKSTSGAIMVDEQVEFFVQCDGQDIEKMDFILTKCDESAVAYTMCREKNGYKLQLQVTSKGLYFYHFSLTTQNGDVIWIGRDDSLQAVYDGGREWQLTVYDNVYEKPEWMSGGIIYQILPDRFFVGGERINTKQDVVYREDWEGIPEYRPTNDGRILNNDFFGGNLLGITKKLGYLKSLGVTCLYLNPIFEAYSNHKYDTANYRKVDPDFGTIDDLRLLIKRADKKGIKIILDGVFSHTGDDSIYFNKYRKYDSVGAYQGEESAYYEWYNFDVFPDKYNCWWNMEVLPNVNECNKHFLEYITGIGGVLDMWTSLGIGGWRWDVVDELPDEFIDKAVKAVKRANNQAIVLGEIWEDASNKISYSKRRRYLLGGQMDSVMNYPFKEDIIDFVRYGNSQGIAITLEHITNNYPKHVLDNLMNLLSTHDTVRLFTVFGEYEDTSSRDKRAVAKLSNTQEALTKVKMASLLQFLLPGIPSIYYGDEIGMEGFEDPFNRAPMQWDNKNKAALKWYKTLGRIRTEQKNILADGEYKCLYAQDGVFAFERQKQGDKLIVIVNNGDADYAFADKGYTDLLTMKEYNGVVKSKEYVLLKKTDKIELK